MSFEPIEKSYFEVPSKGHFTMLKKQFYDNPEGSQFDKKYDVYTTRQNTFFEPNGKQFYEPITESYTEFKNLPGKSSNSAYSIKIESSQKETIQKLVKKGTLKTKQKEKDHYTESRYLSEFDHSEYVPNTKYNQVNPYSSIREQTNEYDDDEEMKRAIEMSIRDAEESKSRLHDGAYDEYKGDDDYEDESEEIDYEAIMDKYLN